MGDLTNHHCCVAPTWVMHGSKFAPECSPHISLRYRMREWMNEPITVGDVYWMSQFGTLPGHWGTPHSLPQVPWDCFMTTVSQDCSFMSHLKDSGSYSTGSPSLHWGIDIDLTAHSHCSLCVCSADTFLMQVNRLDHAHCCHAAHLKWKRVLFFHACHGNIRTLMETGLH